MQKKSNEEGILDDFNLQRLIADLRAAAAAADAHTRVRDIMTRALRDPDAVRAAMAGYSGEEEILFEDDSLTVMYCGFDPAKHVPPHDHRMPVTIGVYAGADFSYAIHVYLGRLKQVERALYDWDSGVPIPFSDESYARLERVRDPDAGTGDGAA